MIHTCVVVTVLMFAPPPAERQPTAVLVDSLSGAQKEDRDSFLREQSETIRSDPVLRAALRRPGVAGLRALRGLPDPLAWLRENLQVDVPKDGGGAIRIWVRGGGADGAVLTNAVVDAYLEGIAAALRRRGENLLAELIKSRARCAEDLESHRRRLRQLPALNPVKPEDAKLQKLLELEKARWTEAIKGAEAGLQALEWQIQSVRAEGETPPRLKLKQRARISR